MGPYFWVASFSSPWSPKLPSYPCLALVLASSSPHLASILEPSGGSTLEKNDNIQRGILLFKNREKNVDFFCFSQLPVRPTCDCARSVKTSILRPSPAVCPCCLRLRYDTSFGKTLAQRSKILKIYRSEYYHLQFVKMMSNEHVFSQLLVRPTCDCVARSAYLRLRSLGENQHSAAFACGMPLLPSPAV